ncbi:MULTISPECIES: TRAP transporter permease [unclassified Beijerinckia]|uniref:TRAP transporter permease n=1 Tax=unclassified Beijerinckia TaxID=2638183 RepID=UPI00089CEE54|nr:MULTISPECIES: TRAP transporter permease [unclassified Beijerinckia]MDH7799305.1 TRAP transporter 4TM/12TM fusion protein [Beijerinckia sp. GAS462]SED45616.1 TRAP transporter, 4TM/12TM fusion protein [Beijerinckia sp. 28-YEA-48]
MTHTLTELEIEHGLPPGWGGGVSGRVLFWIAFVFAAFQVATSLYAFLPAQVLRTVHVGFLTLVGAALIANHKTQYRLTWYVGWAAGLIAFACGLYHWFFYTDLVNRAGELLPIDLVVGVVTLVILFVVSWMLMGAALPLICLAFLAYALWGQYLPVPFDHRGYSLEQVIDQMNFGTEGIYGTPTGISATYIFLFVLFGAFLERAGMIQLFNDVAMGLVGWARGGAAKVAVISSAMMGTISGSGVANVVTVGQFTIPLMKRFGYRSTFAGGVEATASMGGQIMPPVMGAVAFIMAENIGVPYVEIVKAAIIPAILYFASAFWMVHLEAGKHGLLGIPRSELPSPLQALKRQWHLALPLVVLVVLLMDGFTPLFAGSVGLALTAIMILGGAIALNISQTALRYAFWIAVGLIAAALFKFGVWIIVALVGTLILLNLFTRGGRDTLIMCRDALADGSRQALPVGLACAIVGTVIGTMTLTGAASTFGNYIVSFGRESLFICLLLVMFTSLVLGTGLPTIPTYIITASLAAPALLKLGVPLIVSHMFVFYYGIIADLTPPVALAALAAAPIAKASPDAIGWQACRIAIAGFLIPFMAVYEPSLMLQDGGRIAAEYGYWIEVAYVSFKAVLVITVTGVAAIGFYFARTSWPERILHGVAAVAFISPLPWSDTLALTLTALLTAWSLFKARQPTATAPSTV